MWTAAVGAAIAFAVAAGLVDTNGEGGKLLFCAVRAAFAANVLLSAVGRLQEFCHSTAFGAFVLK